MLVVSDVQDVFVPLLDGFLVKLSESEAVIDTYVFTNMFTQINCTVLYLDTVRNVAMIV